MITQLEKSQKRTTIGNFTFLLISFPFGLIYFLILTIGLSLSVSTLIIWIGIPILFVTLASIQGIAAIERGIVATLLHIPMLHYPAPRSDYGPRQTFIRRFSSYLRDPLTWTSAVYMLLKLPLGIISFTLVLVFPLVTGILTLLPLGYLLTLFIDTILLKNGIHSSSEIIPYFIEIHDGMFDLTTFIHTFMVVPVGLLLWFVTRYMLNVLALMQGELARALLCRNDRYMMDQPKAS